MARSDQAKPVSGGVGCQGWGYRIQECVGVLAPRSAYTPLDAMPPFRPAGTGNAGPGIGCVAATGRAAKQAGEIDTYQGSIPQAVMD